MTRIFRRKLLAPSFPEALPRPRLLTLAGTARLLLVQAPSGAGKTVFLAQWLAGRGRSGVWYSLDAGDRDPAVFCAHLVDGFRRLDSEWNPPPEALADAGELAVELVSQGFEADLVLDGAEAVFGQPWLADFLAVVARYAPPGFALAVAGRAPLPVSGVTVTAADLAFTADEVPSLAGEMPVVASVSRAELGARLRAGMPPHIAPERGRTLVDSYLSGQLGLAEFGHQVSCAPPGAEQLWSELGQARHLFLLGEFRAAQALLSATWDSARGRGNPALVGATALLMGDTYYGLGEYDQALEWYRQGFEADPALETTGNCAKAFILRDQGFLAEAEALARRCVEACTGRGDLQALSFAKLQYGWMCAWAGRFDEAEREAEEAQRIGQQCPEPLYGLIALLHRAGIAGMEQNQTVYRRLAEEGYTLARGRSPWLEALAGYILAGALLRWGDREQAGRLVARSFEILTRIECKYQIHMLLSITAQAAWVDGRVQEARAQFDRALTLAAAQGYTYILAGEGYQLRPLLIDAMVRGVEVAFCQRVLVQQGVKALPGLLELTQAPDAGARRAALYPLSAIGGEEATAAVRRLMHDEDERVRDSALLAMKSLGFPSVPATAAPVAPVAAAGVSVSVLGPLV
ncbi:MAG TPA: HEAT repeat domain-containing protein, partial [Symbiobacteriaceae bacterium]|nr:HEAT repeat domain-containing protein [Symbiobacteriaceae bacterium]